MYKYNRRKQLIKSFTYIFFILLLAVVSTYFIYNKFQDNRSIDFNSESLDVTYHELSGDKLTLTKITPVTDSVGLSSKAYFISIKNNLTEGVDYKIKIVDDLQSIAEDFCEDKLIPKEDIRISVKINHGPNKIYGLAELENGVLLDEEVAALATDEVAIRLWIKQDSILPMGSNLHYHGLMQVVEEDTSVAINK